MDLDWMSQNLLCVALHSSTAQPESLLSQIIILESKLVQLTKSSRKSPVNFFTKITVEQLNLRTGTKNL